MTGDGGRSWKGGRRIDPGVKFVGLLSVSIAVFATFDLVYQLVFLIISLGALAASGITRRMFYTQTRGFVTVIVFIFLIQLFLYPGGRTFLIEVPIPRTDWVLPLISLEGLHFGLAVASRFLTVIFLAVAFNASTPPSDLLNALLRWRMPYSLAFMINVALRLLPEMASDAGDVAAAQRARGVRREQLTYRQRLKATAAVMRPMVLRYLMRARTMSQAMECRGLEPGRERTQYRSMVMDGRDVALLTAFISMTVLVLLVDWTGWFEPEKILVELLF